MADTEDAVLEGGAPQPRSKSVPPERTGPEKAEQLGSTPTTPTASPIGAFYPGLGFLPLPSDLPHFQLGPFASTLSTPIQPPLYNQPSALPYGMLYPTQSYDVSVALAALAVGEARALLQSTQELHNVTAAAKAAPPAERAQIREEQDIGEGLGRIPCQSSSLTFLEKFKSARGRGTTLRDVLGNVALIALDQMGSRWLQRQLDETGRLGAELIAGEVLDNAVLLSRDVFGNYVVQKTIEYASQEKKDAIAKAMKSRMRRLAFDRLVEHVSTDVAIDLVRELEDVVLSCVVDSNASHVIQKCIQFLPSDQMLALLEQLCGNIKSVGKDPTGCRVVQRLVEYCSLKDVRERVLDEVIDGVTELATSEYGNYVVQHVAEHGGPKHRCKAMRRIGTNFRLFSHHRYASRVVEKFLAVADDGEKRYMIGSMFAIDEAGRIEETWALDMMLDPFANYIVQKILEVSEEHVREKFVEVIVSNKTVVLGSGYGKKVADAAINMGLLKAQELRSPKVDPAATADCP